VDTDRERKIFLELAGSERELGQVTQRFHEVIERSFVTDAGRVLAVNGIAGGSKMTHDEVRHRFGIVADWFKTFRGDLGWSLQRTLSELPQALRKTLDGEDYNPATRSMWAPEET